MKNVFLGLTGFILLIFVACSGSETYRGDWKATDANGGRSTLHFDAKMISVTDSTGNVQTYEYSQNSVNIENSISTYGIQLSDGRIYKLTFPVPSKQTVALLKDESGQTIYALCRDEFIDYHGLYKLD